MLLHLILGGLAGFIVGKLMRGEGYGFIVDIILGLVGGWVGGWLFGRLGITMGGNIGHFIAALVGAAVLVLLVRFIKQKV